MENIRGGGRRPTLGTAVRRAVSRRCPSCGSAPLFASYLKQVARCSACDEAFGHIRSDDAAPWLTILIVGHLLVPLVLAVESTVVWPMWISMVLWPTIALVLALLCLPYAKGLFLGAIWAMRAEGSEKG